MAKNKKPNKPYKPKRKVGNLLAYMAKVDPKVVTSDLVGYQLSLDAMLRGDGNEHHSDMITGLLNACAIFCLQHDWLEDYEYAVLGQQAHQAMINRYKAGKRMLYSGTEMGRVKYAFEIYKQQVPIMTPKDMVNAAQLVGQTLVKRKHIK